MKNKIKEKKIQGVSSNIEVPGLAEAAHNALGASISRFSNDRPYFKAEIVDPKKYGLVGCFCKVSWVATLANNNGKKKIPTKTHPRTPCSIKSGSTTKRRV